MRFQNARIYATFMMGMSELFVTGEADLTDWLWDDRPRSSPQ
jgi:hypothetical protein